MADNNQGGLLGRIRGNAEWEFIKFIGGSSMMTSVWQVCIASIHHVRPDWLMWDAVFGAGISLAGFGYWRQRHLPKGKSLTVSEAHPTLDLQKKQEAAITENTRLLCLGSAIDGVLVAIQIELLDLSFRLLHFAKSLGDAPLPKYSLQDVHSMADERQLELLEAKDMDWLEACVLYRLELGEITQEEAYEYSASSRESRLAKWFSKVEGKYNLDLRPDVERMRNRLAAEGLIDNHLEFAFTFCFDPKERIRKMASRLWEIAYKVAEREVQSENC